jgi:superfamily II DNA/RNA helicase
VSHDDQTFADLGVQIEICQALEKVGITHPFPIQAMTLPVAMTGHDIIGQAKTGTGKTLGFAVPLLQRVSGPGEPGWDQLAKPGAPQALVVVPTRELAVQVAGDVTTAGALRAARVLTVYGGRAYEPQIEALKRGVEIVVGTPGRLLDLAQQGHLSLAHARAVVLDEADEMLDLGFLPDVERMLAMTPAGRQTMLFSATMPGAVVALARRYMTQPTHIRAADPDDTGATVKATKQFAYRAHSMDKVEVLARLLQANGRGLSIVFTRTKRTAAKVAEDLADRGFASAAIHGDLGQGAREQALRAFRNGKVDVLVATDVAARGIDVENVTHVINYQCPEDEKTYLHRIGRTGRAGKIGTAVTFVDWDDLPRWGLIDKTLDLGLPAPEETYSTSAHLFTDLDIPTSASSVLPRAARTRAGLAAELVEDLGETGGRGRRGEATGPDRRPGGRSRPSGGGGDSRGGQSRGSQSRGSESRGSEPHSSSDGDAADGAGPERNRTRQRRRTRAGQPVGEQNGTAAVGSVGSVGSAGASSGPAVEPGSEGDPDRPRRRRRRGGRGRGRAGESGESGEATAAIEA